MLISTNTGKRLAVRLDTLVAVYISRKEFLIRLFTQSVIIKCTTEDAETTERLLKAFEGRATWPQELSVSDLQVTGYDDLIHAVNEIVDAVYARGPE